MTSFFCLMFGMNFGQWQSAFNSYTHSNTEAVIQAYKKAEASGLSQDYIKFLVALSLNTLMDTSNSTLCELFSQAVAPFMKYYKKNQSIFAADTWNRDFYQKILRKFLYSWYQNRISLNELLPMLDDIYEVTSILLEINVLKYNITKKTSTNYKTQPENCKYVEYSLYANDMRSYSTGIIASSGFLHFSIPYLSNERFFNFYIKMLQLLSPAFCTEYCSFLAEELVPYYHRIEILDILIKMNIPDDVQNQIIENYFLTFHELMKNDQEECIKRLRSLSQVKISNALALGLKNFMLDQGFSLFKDQKHNDFTSKILVNTISLMTHEEIDSILRFNNSLIPFAAELVLLDTELLEKYYSMDPKGALPHIIQAFESNSANFTNKREILETILHNSSKSDIFRLLTVANNYADEIKSIISENTDFDPNYLLTLCNFIKQTGITGDFSKIADALIDSLDSLYLARTFAYYTFLPINDPELFYMLTPDCDFKYKALLQRKLYVKIKGGDNNWNDYAIKAFDSNHDTFFAENLVSSEDIKIIQKLIDELKSIDFMINKNIDYNISTKLNLEKVVAKDYSKDLAENHQLFELIHRIPKIDFGFNESLAQKINDLLISKENQVIALYYLDNAVPFANNKFWKLIKSDIPIIDETISMPSVAFYSMQKMQKIDYDFLIKLLPYMLQLNDTKAFEDFINAFNGRKLKFEEISSLLLPNTQSAKILLQNTEITPEIATEFILSAPENLIPDLIKIATKDSQFNENIALRLSAFCIDQQNPEKFESDVESILINLEGQFAAELASKIFFSKLPESFRTDKLMKTLSIAFAKSPTTFKNNLMNANLVPSYSSPFIRAIGSLHSFCANSKSKLAKDAISACSGTSIPGYSKFGDLQSNLPKDFDFEYILMTEGNESPKYSSYNYIHVVKGKSVQEGLDSMFDKYEDSDINGKSVMKQTFISKAPENVIILLQNTSASFIVDKEIDLNKYSIPGNGKVYKLAAFVGQDDNKKYYLNKQKPYVAFYTSNPIPEPFYYEETNEYYVGDDLLRLDYNCFADKFEIPYLLVKELNYSDLIKKLCNENQDFINESFETHLEELCMLPKSAFNDILEFSKKFYDSELLIQLCSGLLSNDSTRENAMSLLLFYNVSYEQMVDIFIANNAKLVCLLERHDKTISYWSEENILKIFKDKEARIHLMKYNDEKLTKYFLPLNDDDPQLLCQYSSNRYAAKVLILNNDSKLASKVLYRLSNVPEFVDFADTHEVSADYIYNLLESNNVDNINRAYRLAKENDLIGKLDDRLATLIRRIVYGADPNTSNEISRITTELSVCVDLLSDSSILTQEEVNRIGSLFISCLILGVKHHFYNQLLKLKKVKWTMISNNPFIAGSSEYLLALKIIAMIKTNSSNSALLLYQTKLNSMFPDNFYQALANVIHEELLSNPYLDQDVIHSFFLFCTNMLPYTRPMFEDKSIWRISKLITVFMLIIAVSEPENISISTPSLSKFNDFVYEFRYDIPPSFNVPTLMDTMIQQLNIYHNQVAKYKDFLAERMRGAFNFALIVPYFRYLFTSTDFVKDLRNLLNGQFPDDVAAEYSRFAVLLVEEQLQMQSRDKLIEAVKVLFYAFEVSKNSWNATMPLLSTLHTFIKSESKDVVSQAYTKTFFWSLRLAPNDYEWSKIREMTAFILKISSELNVSALKEFINSIKVDKSDLEKVIITVSILRKADPQTLGMFKQEFDQKFKDLMAIPECAKWLKYI